MPKPGCIVGLFTDLFAPGGVQRAGRHVAAVCAQFAAAHGLSYSFLSLNDSHGVHTERIGAIEITVSGYARNKSQFLRAAWRAAGHGPILVFALHPHLAPIVELMRWRSQRFRSVVFSHGIEVWKPLKWPRRPALRRANFVIAPSRNTGEHLISEQKICKERIRQLPWGLDPEFEMRIAAWVPTSRPQFFPKQGQIILTVGRWEADERYKGADTLLLAMPQLLKSLPDAALVIVGDGSDRGRLEKLSRDLGLSEHAFFLHGLTQDELFACYAHCSVFALPSRCEGFGLVFLEAMANGKPVIGGAHGGIPDVIEDGVTGLLVSHGDVPQLASALTSLLTESQRACAMGALAQKRVQANYSFSEFQSRLSTILKETLSSPR